MANFPSTGGAVNWENLAQTYCSPSGNDSSAGTGWTNPKKHIYNAIETVINAGGGTVYIAPGCSVGGPVAGQGIRLRADFIQGAVVAFDAPGFLGGSAPLRLVGVGRSNGTPSFFTSTMAAYTGGDSRFNPPLWVVGSNPMPSIRIENLRGSDSAQLGARIGPDFDRRLDGTLKDVIVSNATRTGTTTVFTVTLGDALTIKSASRTSNVTTLYLDNPGLPWIPARANAPIVFTSGDSDFPSGAFVLTSTSNGLDVPDDTIHWRMSYSDPGPDVVKKDIAASSFKTHGCCAGEIFDLTSNSAHFANTQFTVVSVNSNGLGITVTDVFGDGDANVNNIGHINHQERYSNPTCNFQMKNCTYLCNSADPNSYHGIDVGNNSAMTPQFYNCGFSGTVGNGSGPRDEDRMSAMFVYPGTGPSGAVASVYMRECGSTDGSVYVKAYAAQGYCTTDIANLITDTSFPGLGLPAVRIDGNGFSRCILDQIFNADTDPSFNCVVLNNMPPSGCYVTRSGKVKGACNGGDNWINPNLWIASSSPSNSPWAYRQVTNWADGRITGKHPGPNRAMGVLGSRFKNIIVDSSSWTLRGSTLATAQAAPDGSSTADKITSAGDFVSIFPSGTDGSSWAVGGHLVIGGWVNVSNPALLTGPELFRVQTNDITFVEGPLVACPFSGVGWQWVSAVLTVATVASSTPTFEIETLIPNTGVCFFWGLTAFYIPDTMGDNDAMEVAGTLKHLPRYLHAGMAGTMEGQKLVAHGGLATAKYYTVGGGAGQITIGSAAAKAIEVFDEAGNSLGVLRPSAFTIN